MSPSWLEKQRPIFRIVGGGASLAWALVGIAWHWLRELAGIRDILGWVFPNWATWLSLLSPPAYIALFVGPLLIVIALGWGPRFVEEIHLVLSRIREHRRSEYQVTTPYVQALYESAFPSAASASAPNPFPIDPKVVAQQPKRDSGYLNALEFTIAVHDWIQLRAIGRPQKSDYPSDSLPRMMPMFNPGGPYDNRTAYEYRQKFHERANAILTRLKEAGRSGSAELDGLVQDGPSPNIVHADVKRICKYLRYLEDGTTGEPW